MTDPYIRAMFGVHALHTSAQIIIQDMGTREGRNLTLAGAIITTPERIITPGYTHELIVGDMVIRPFGKWASNHFQGYGMAGLLKSDAMFPQGHEVQTLDNGWNNMNIQKR